MRRLLVLLMALALLLPVAHAEEARGLELEIESVMLEPEWQGEASETHVWLVIDATITNWRTEALDVQAALGAKLEYAGGYEFDGSVCFDTARIEPLVVLQGAIVVRIPNLVADDLQNASLSVSCEGTPRSIPLEISGGSFAAGKSGSLEGAGYDCPEDAVSAYLEAMKRGSLKDMVSTFAVETRAARMDSAKYLARLRASSVQMYQTIPAANDYLLEIRTEKVYDEIVNGLYMQYLLYATLGTEYYDSLGSGYLLALSDEDAQAAYLEVMSSSGFAEACASCEFVEWIDPGTLSELYNSEINQKNIAQQAACLGADEMWDLAAHLTLNGTDYLQTMSCVRYGDRWYNLSSAGNLSSLLNISVYCGGLAPMDDLQLD